MDIDEILGRFNLKYEDLNTSERETLNTWLSALRKDALTLSDVKSFIATLRDSVEQELTKMNHNTVDDIFSKARLRNLMLIEAFLTSPEKAERELNRALEGIQVRKR